MRMSICPLSDRLKNIVDLISVQPNYTSSKKIQETSPQSLTDNRELLAATTTLTTHAVILQKVDYYHWKASDPRENRTLSTSGEKS